MSKKFTEEQFNLIIKEYEDESKDDFSPNCTLRHFIELNRLENERDDIRNPLTREWAHDKFVEKEKRYYWTSKGEDSKGLKRRLYIKADRVRDYFEDEFLYNDNEVLTEQQVYQWGYNPDMFDKEEVK